MSFQGGKILGLSTVQKLPYIRLWDTYQYSIFEQEKGNAFSTEENAVSLSKEC